MLMKWGCVSKHHISAAHFLSAHVATALLLWDNQISIGPLCHNSTNAVSIEEVCAGDFVHMTFRGVERSLEHPIKMYLMRTAKGSKR